ncbi:MAG TPA: Asd/ArgC dimerization domain-containing protein, partial [Candidatus Atribacteria bacterium]|nr:Asd/ArgC dimerization domain-containing protein [Candidatus Atribacteria bacterium]
ENFKAYKVGEHRHQPEMKEQLELATGEEVNLIFTPHLLPLKRGILTTIYLSLKKDLEEEELLSIWKDYWGGKPWVRIFPLHRFPELRWVVGSNFIDLGLKKVGENQLIVISALDNLVKGAAGQAVQNLNLMFGKEEKEGLPEDVLYP